VILDRNPLKAPPAELFDLVVVETTFGLALQAGPRLTARPGWLSCVCVRGTP
jgi:hypothetical protein